VNLPEGPVAVLVVSAARQTVSTSDSRLLVRYLDARGQPGCRPLYAYELTGWLADRLQAGPPGVGRGRPRGVLPPVANGRKRGINGESPICSPISSARRGSTDPRLASCELCAQGMVQGSVNDRSLQHKERGPDGFWSCVSASVSGSGQVAGIFGSSLSRHCRRNDYVMIWEDLEGLH